MQKNTWMCLQTRNATAQAAQTHSQPPRDVELSSPQRPTEEGLHPMHVYCTGTSGQPRQHRATAPTCPMLDISAEALPTAEQNRPHPGRSVGPIHSFVFDQHDGGTPRDGTSCAQRRRTLRRILGAGLEGMPALTIPLQIQRPPDSQSSGPEQSTSKVSPRQATWRTLPSFPHSATMGHMVCHQCIHPPCGNSRKAEGTAGDVAMPQAWTARQALYHKVPPAANTYPSATPPFGVAPPRRLS